jgi:hypothetical protein
MLWHLVAFKSLTLKAAYCRDGYTSITPVAGIWFRLTTITSHFPSARWTYKTSTCNEQPAVRGDACLRAEGWYSGTFFKCGERKNPIQWSGGNMYLRMHRTILGQHSSAGDPVTVLITGAKYETICTPRLVVWMKGEEPVSSKDVMSIECCRYLPLSLSLSLLFRYGSEMIATEVPLLLLLFTVTCNIKL